MIMYMHDAMATMVATCITRVSKDISNTGFPIILRVMSVIDIAIRIIVEITISQSSPQPISISHNFAESIFGGNK